MKSTIRVASHAGDWYSDDKIELANELSKYLSNSTKVENNQYLKSLIAPHSGLEFGGPTAAKSFINVNPSQYNRVVIMGPSHYQYFKGCALTPFEKFETPFGEVKVDTEINQNLVSKYNKKFFYFPQSDDVQEHSIEMEMPFIKYIFENRDISIVPIIVGSGGLKQNIELGKCLYDLYEDPKTLFVISSDFCHWGSDFDYTYYNKNFKTIWESTQDLDKRALDIIGEMNSEKFDKYIKETKNTICGRNPISIVLSMIEEYKNNHKDKKIRFDTVGYSQSEKCTKMYQSSVSYAAGVNLIV